MNPGYLSLILMCLTVILLASGWKEVLLPGIADRSIVAFIVCWIALSRTHVPLPGSASIEISLIVLPLTWLVLRAAVKKCTWLAVLNFISVGLFLAALYYLLCYFAQADPLFFPYDSPSIAAAFLGLVTILIVRNANDPIGVLTFALLAGAALYTAVIYPNLSSNSYIFGDRSFQDQWWAAVVSARLASLCVQTIWSFGTSTLRGWVSRNTGNNDERKE